MENRPSLMAMCLTAPLAVAVSLFILVGSCSNDHAKESQTTAGTPLTNEQARMKRKLSDLHNLSPYDGSVYAKRHDYVLSAGMMGNHSYIPLNIIGLADDYVVEILAVLKFFEEVHIDLEVTSWNIEKSRDGQHYIYGLWVNHRPRN